MGRHAQLHCEATTRPPARPRAKGEVVPPGLHHRADWLAWLKQQPAFKGPRRRVADPPGHVRTGFADLDVLLGGGLPRGDLCELIGPSGRTALALATLGAATQGGEMVAWIDPGNALDPLSVQGAGVCLERFLWIRPTGRNVLKQALKAADLVLDAGGFALLVLDIEDLRLSSWPAWRVRLSRRVEASDTALIILGGAGTGFCAGLRLQCRRRRTSDTPDALGLEVRVIRRRGAIPRGAVFLSLGRPVD